MYSVHLYFPPVQATERTDIYHPRMSENQLSKFEDGVYGLILTVLLLLFDRLLVTKKLELFETYWWLPITVSNSNIPEP